MSDRDPAAPAHADQPKPGHDSERHGNPLDHAFERAEQALIYLVALFLIAFALLSLLNTVLVIKDPIFVEHDYNKALTIGFDSAFLTIILLEVLHTVLSRSSLIWQVQEFLVIGITSAVRHSLGLAASGNGTHPQTQTICSMAGTALGSAKQACRVISVDVPNSSAQEVVLDLAINAAAVLLLVAALWLVRQQRGHHDD